MLYDGDSMFWLYGVSSVILCSHDLCSIRIDPCTCVTSCKDNKAIVLRKKMKKRNIPKESREKAQESREKAQESHDSEDVAKLEWR
jgi:hypothetical protein